MASKKTNGIKHRQTGKVKGIEEVFAEKRKVLSQLSEEYQEVLEKDVVVYETGNEIKILNAQYRRLLSEINVTKSLEPEIMPNDPDFLFEWVKTNLEKETETLQNTLANQDEIIEELYQGKKLLRISGQDSSFAEENSSDTENSEKEEVMLGLMQGLHRKLAKRLKKLVTSNFTSCSEGETSSNNSEISSEMSSKKNLYKILKVFFSELQNQTNFDISAKPEITIDKSYPIEHLQLLVDCDIIEVISQDPLTLSLKEP